MAPLQVGLMAAQSVQPPPRGVPPQTWGVEHRKRHASSTVAAGPVGKLLVEQLVLLLLW